MGKKSLERVKADAATALEKYFTEGENNIDLLRSAGAAVVELRSRFQQKDGSTDWAGRSQDYRDAIRDVYTRAHLSQDQVSKLPGKLGYHVRQALGARISADELEAAGFKAEDPKIRQNARRTTAAALAATVAPSVTPAVLIVHANSLLKRADSGDGLAEMTEQEREVCRIALAAIEKHAASLSKALAG
ncbi:hypothetical protein [Kribbella sp. CA-293567]|uniref:hypothetical protein n=1 Tax=Kribbella sp. CA-293567 TaxID=3002436 RepID=UPI0022DD0B7E|nr:hypothetical protein [Kribbella sp. CA-293567]WBQ03799.1 hypothetical protein OX958_27995 [Kribbella sp. CA-293567]